MAPRKRYMSYSSSSLPAVATTPVHPERLAFHQTKLTMPYSQHSQAPNSYRKTHRSSDCVSVGSSLSEDMTDEEEIWVRLNPKAMALLPKRLQKIMQEIQAERYERLQKEKPNLRIMSSDYWIRPVEPVHREPVRYNRAPTPLYFAAPSNRNAFRANGSSANPTIQSLGPGHHYRWAAYPTVEGQSQRPATSTGYPSIHTAQSLHGPGSSTKEFQVLNGYRQPLPSNMVFNQKHNKQHRYRRTPGFRSLSVKPVASNLRKHLKRSLSRLNKWIKNEL